jgi:ABC-type sulfate transport system permease component
MPRHKAFVGALVGLVCALPFAVGGIVLAAALAPAFFALAPLLGLLFWLLALRRNNRLVRRPADARGDGTGQ